MRKNVILLCIAILSIINITAAQKAITLEDIWYNGTFRAKSVPGFNFQNDGKHYTKKEAGKIQQYDLTTGEKTKTIFDATAVTGNADYNGEVNSYTFSKDESKMLIKTETEAIYRRSTKANFFVWDRTKKQLHTLSTGGKQGYATFNTNADKVAFVRGNNLFYKDLSTGKEIQITTDGKQNEIINGSTDWVYEEEFAIARVFEWSPDGQQIAFLRFDETDVKEFTMTMYRDELYPEYSTFKYPKVGEKNAIVTVHIYNLATGKITQVKTGTETDVYFPRIAWTPDSKKLCVFKMNRHQNNLELLLADTNDGSTTTMLTEKNKYYIDIHDNLTFLPNGNQFLWTSEQDGYNHIYLYYMNGRVAQQLTKGNYEVTNFYGYDAKRKLVYYQAAENSPLERQVYSINLKGEKKKLLTPKKGWNEAQFSSTYDYYVLTHSDANTPPTYVVYNNKGKVTRSIEENGRVQKLKSAYQVAPVEFIKIRTSEDVELNATLIKPTNFDPNKKYPLFMYLYGGPGSQQVKDKWNGMRYYWWFQMLAQKDYVIAIVDNRGTGGRGEFFKKQTYLKLGDLETKDQIEAAKILGTYKYVDPKRIGIFGWSYGGYMSSLCILKGNDVFKAAIAIAPVTNWKWYDSIYTERYMRTEKENPNGYHDNSPIYFADRLKGNYLLVHGVGDDNVHFQNTAEMANALILANKQFDTYFYPNRNHSIYGGYTRLHLFTKMTDFLLEKL